MKDEPQKPRNPRILLALLDFEMRSRLQTVLTGASYEVVTCSQRENLPQLAAVTDELPSYDLVIWDVEMLDEDAVRRIERLQGRSEFPPLILVTAFSDHEALKRVGSLKSVGDFDMPLDNYHHLAMVLRIAPP